MEEQLENCTDMFLLFLLQFMHTCLQFQAIGPSDDEG